MTNILVLGATGKTGRQIVDQALARGWRVVAMVRDPAKLDISHEHLQIVKGDMADAGSLDRALAGSIDAVVSALGVYSKEASTALSEGTKKIVAAMQRAGVRRIVVVSSLGVGESAGQGSFIVRMVQKFILKEVLIDKTRQEAILRDSALDWTSLRPPQLTDAANIRNDLVVWSGSIQPKQRLTWKTNRATVARYVLDAVQSRRWIGEAVCMSEPA